MVVYASATDVSVGRMFLAGVIPGLMAGTMLMLTIYIMARVKKLPQGEWRGWGEVFASGREAGWGLMLIVIFLAALPLSQRGLDINLPLETRGAQQAAADASQIVLQYTADRVITINQQPVAIQQLEERLRTIFEQRREKTMFIAGAGNLRYGEIIDGTPTPNGAG